MWSTILSPTSRKLKISLFPVFRNSLPRSACDDTPYVGCNRFTLAFKLDIRSTCSDATSSTVSGHQGCAFSLIAAFKHVGKETTIIREQIHSEYYINHSIRKQLNFPALYSELIVVLDWKKMRFIRNDQATWNNDRIEISEETAKQLRFIEKSTLINEDTVTCAIYCNKMVTSRIMNILKSKKIISVW